MKNILYISLCFLMFFVVVSCSKDDEAYPALITELVMSTSDAQGVFTTFTTDDGCTYQISNTVKGPSPNVRWRFVCGYVKDDETTARVYTFIRVPLLPDYTQMENRRRDATNIASVWKGGGYINLHLLPLTQGAQQAWGFIRDSIKTNDAGGSDYFISLSHYQLNDMEAYTTDLFVSLDLDSVATTRYAIDSIFFSVKTYDGIRSWSFGAD